MQPNNEKKIMILDTEYENSPRRLISIAYLIVENTQIISHYNNLIKHNPHVFTIDETSISFNIHKITNKQCQEHGIPIHQFFEDFKNDLQNIDILVGHNLMSADLSTIRREAIGINIWNTIFPILKEKQFIDTISFYKKLKSNLQSYSLDSIYFDLFKTNMKNHHSALDDCKATLEIYNELINICSPDFQLPNMWESEIERQKNQIIFCSQCPTQLQKRNHYRVKDLSFSDRFGVYQFYLINQGNIKPLQKNDLLCFKCYDNIEVLKTLNQEMFDLLNKNIQKTSFKYTEYQNTKKNCIDQIILQPTITKENIIFLDCPYEDHKECRQLGAKWDRKNKKWYILKDNDTTLFEKWLNVEQ